jgi:CubicO group peptidase (beta-lactamase class C family)
MRTAAAVDIVHAMEEQALNDSVASAAGHVPGVAAIFVGREGVRARSAVGFADLRARTPMTTDAAAPWFSMTKIATATTAMRLSERGLLDLDAPVHPLVPEMAALRPSAWAERITPRHLLQHAAGLTNPIPVSWIHPADAPGPDPAAFLSRQLTKHPKLAFEPGDRSSYSNLGTLVLGAAIANRTSQRFEDVVRTELLGPLTMTSTDFTYPAGPAATGYHPRFSPMRALLPRWVTGATSGRWVGFRRFLLDGAAYGGLVGTADDAARFLQLHLRGGELDGTRLLADDSAAQMCRIDALGKRYCLGLGWFVPTGQRDAEPPFVEHLGGGAGFFNVMRMYPTLGVGAVVFGNATKYDVHGVADLATEFA